MKIYTYKNCSTCKKALKWLDAKELKYEEFPIRETPPSRHELEEMLERYQGDLKKLFNVSGRDYRELDLKSKLPGMSKDEAIELLQSNGNLVKRPFILSDGEGVVGFKEEEWTEKIR